MAAAAGEGSAVQELHCEHKAKAEGEGRDQAAAPPSLPPPKKNRATPTLFLALIFSHSGPHDVVTSVGFLSYTFSAGQFIVEGSPQK